MSTQELDLSLIVADPAIQSRACVDDEVVNEYARLLATGAEFPPSVVYFDGTIYRLAGGFHRHRAYVLAGRKTMPVEIRQGSIYDAIAFSISENQTHGLHRSNADKQRAVQLALAHPIIGKWSIRDIAKKCSVGDTMVWEARKSQRPASNILDGNGQTNDRKAPAADGTEEVHGSEVGKVPSEGSCPQVIDDDPDDPLPERTAANKHLYALVAKLAKHKSDGPPEARAEWQREMATLRKEVDIRFYDTFQNIGVLSLDRIRLDPKLHLRYELSQEYVDKYAQSMRYSDFFPPCVVFYDGQDFLMADGFHRYHAMKRAGIDEMTVDARKGNWDDAFAFALRANHHHAPAPTDEDVRYAVTAALKHRPDYSNQKTARLCRVTASFVQEVRQSFSDKAVGRVGEFSKGRRSNLEAVAVIPVAGSAAPLP